MEQYLHTIFKFISPFADADFVGMVYVITCIMIISVTGMPLFIRLSLALPLAVTGIVFIFIPDTIPVQYEQVVLVRLSHLVFMLSLIINSIFYGIVKRKRMVR